MRDISNLKMTRCELQLDSALHTDNIGNANCNPDVNYSTATEVSPVPVSCHKTQQNYVTLFSMNQHDDDYTVCLQKTKRKNISRRETEPGLPSVSNTAYGNALPEDISSPLGQGSCLNISLKKPTALTTSNEHFNATTTAASHSRLLVDVQGHHEDEDSHQLTKDLVAALRNVGDNLDRKMDPNVKKSLLQSIITSTLGDLKRTCPLNSIPEKTLKKAFLFSIQFVTDYNRL